MGTHNINFSEQFEFTGKVKTLSIVGIILGAIAIDAKDNAAHTVIDGLLKDAGALEVKYNERKYISYE